MALPTYDDTKLEPGVDDDDDALAKLELTVGDDDGTLFSSELPPRPMGPPTLAEAKLHLRVDFDDDDTLISSLLLAAIESASNFLGRPIPWPQLDEDGVPVVNEAGEPVIEPVPESVSAAIKLELGALYANREPEAPVRSPAFKALLTPYRIGMGV